MKWLLLLVACGWCAVEAQAQNGTPVLPSPDTPPPASGTPATPDAAQVKSLFFTQDEMDKIRQALDLYIKAQAEQKANNTGEDFVKQLEGTPGDEVEVPQEMGKPVDYTYPQFFLESLAYHSPKDWSVQVNDQKIATDGGTPAGNLSVIAVDQDKAIFEWKPSRRDIGKITPKWQQSREDAPGVAFKEGVVTFALRHNQTFSSYVMRVLEGKVEPVTEHAQNMPVPSAAPAPKPVFPSSPVVDHPSEQPTP